MRKVLAAALIALACLAPSRLFAKGTTTKVVIEGPDLSKPIEITDRKTLANFNVWTGPGTFSTQPAFNANAPSFIFDWPQGQVSDAPQALQKYQVSFYSEELSERPIYVVYYAGGRAGNADAFLNADRSGRGISRMMTLTPVSTGLRSSA
jgi:hypothetical protein